jgi:hypothetical protein
MKVSERPTPRSWRTEHRIVELHRFSMSRSGLRTKWIRRSIVTLLTIALWGFTVAQSGYTAAELAMFAGPGIVLTLAASWSSRVFDRDQWTWVAGMRTVLVGGLISPPLIGFGIAFLTAMNRDAVLLIFILGAWLALTGGVFVACIRALRDDIRQRPPAAPVRLVLHRQSVARPRHRSLVRAGRRPPWVEYRPTTQMPASRQRPSA